MKVTLVAHKARGLTTPQRVVENLLSDHWTHSDEPVVITIEAGPNCRRRVGVGAENAARSDSKAV